MKPRKLKELLVFAIVHKAPNALPANRKEVMEGALMKLNSDELEALEEYLSAICEMNKPQTRRKKAEDVKEVVEEDPEKDIEVEEEEESEQLVMGATGIRAKVN